MRYLTAVALFVLKAGAVAVVGLLLGAAFFSLLLTALWSVR